MIWMPFPFQSCVRRLVCSRALAWSQICSAAFTRNYRVKKADSVTQRIIFFDIDGTLLRTGGAGQLAMERALTEEFRIDQAFDGVTTAGRTDRGIANEIFARYGLNDSETERERFRQAYLERLPGSLHDSPGLLLPGVRELLDELAAMSGVVLSLLTGNYADGAWVKLKHYQLDQYFAFGGFGDHHADRDDVARNAATAARNHLGDGLDFSRACVVGDTPADIRCARAIGSRVAAVATGVFSRDELEPHDPDHLFDDFSETQDVANQIVGKSVRS